MIFRSLSQWTPSLRRHQAGLYTDHILFTERIGQIYEYPEHIASAGVLTMLSGKGEFVLNGKKEQLDAHSFLVVNKGSRLSIHFREPESQPLLLFFRTQLAGRPGALSGPPPDLSWLERIHHKQEELGDAMEWLAKLGDSCSSFSGLKADTIIRGIQQDLTRQSRAAVLLSARLNVAKLSTRVELFRRLSMTRDWVIEQAASPITLMDMAGMAALNHQHFLRSFRQVYQTTPHQFLIEIRLEKARQLLLHTEEKVSEICRQTGFESLSSFSGLFKEKFGVSPSLFRELGGEISK